MPPTLSEAPATDTKLQGELKYIPLAMIRENPVALRTVNREDEEFMRMVDSIRVEGILNPILVHRKDVDKDGRKDGKEFELIDGLHRYTGALEAGLSEIPAQIRDEATADTIKTQIIANLHRKETKASEYTKALLRILATTPGLTEAALAEMLKCSPAFINSRLQLNKLKESILKLVDDNAIPLQNAFALSKLEVSEQDEWVERAMNQPTTEFPAACIAYADKAREAKRAGKSATEEFTANPVLRGAGELKSELATPTVGPQLVKATGATTAEQGFALAIAWSLKVDPESKKAAKAKWDAEQKAKADAKAKREAEKATNKQSGENAETRQTLADQAAAMQPA